DAFVDASDIGVGKPEPEAYLIAAGALGLAAGRIVFLDDAEDNVEGARAVGMVGVQVDAGSAATAFDEARELLGLGS
ncbi:MAG TPA: HAD-IA family hydrolase, partial [Acidimicrobiales bacterium]